MHQGLDFSQVVLGQGGDKVKPTPFILQLSSARKDVVSPSTEGKMADTAPLPLSGEKWSQNIPDRSAGMAAQFRACDTLEDRLQLIQPATVHRRANWKLMTWPPILLLEPRTVEPSTGTRLVALQEPRGQRL